MNHRARNFLRCLALAAPVWLSAQITWVGGTGPSPYDVANDANWASPLAHDGSDSVEFGNVGAGLSLVSVTSGVALHDILFSNNAGPAYVFSGGSPGPFGDVRFNGSVTATANSYATVDSSVGFYLSAINHVFDLGAGASVTLQGGLHDYTTASSITKTGSGTLVLSGANDYSGGTIVHGGALNLVGGALSHGGSNFELGVVSGDTGALQLLSGGVLTDNFGRIGIDSGATGTALVSGAGSTWANNTYLYVGEAGTGSLAISSGATVTSPNTSIGNNAGGSGVVTVDGAGSMLANTNTIFVGAAGTGSLGVTNGAAISSVDGAIGNNTGGSGSVSISDTGSAWTLSGNLFVGAEGAGALTILSGGAASAQNATVGNNTGGTGTLTLSGSGSALAVVDAVRIGEQGDGTLLLSNGATIHDAHGLIGSSTGGNGVVTVSGGSWTSTAGLVVGDVGTGKLEITNGGTVVSDDGLIGNDTGSSGSAVVSGPGSSWTVADEMYVGVFGAGQLTLTGSAILNVGAGSGQLVLANFGASSGTLNFGAGGTQPAAAGGVLNAVQIITGDGDGLVRFKTTATGASPFYLTTDGTGSGAPVALSASTAVVQDAGYTVLLASSNYTGGTTINGGTLVAGGGGNPLGFGQVNVNAGGTLVVEGSHISNSLVFAPGSRLAGNGSVSQATIGAGVTLAPGTFGQAIGGLNFNDLTLGGNGILEFNVGFDDGSLVYDSISVINVTTLSIAADAAHPFTLKLISLALGNTPGALTGGVLAGQTYTIGLFQTNGLGGDPLVLGSNLLIDSSAFNTGLGAGTTFGLVQTGNDYAFTFTPVPEPSTYALLALGLGLVGSTFRRRRIS